MKGRTIQLEQGRAVQVWDWEKTLLFRSLIRQGWLKPLLNSIEYSDKCIELIVTRKKGWVVGQNTYRGWSRN